MPEGDDGYGRRDEDRPVLATQAKFAKVTGWMGIIVGLVTVVFPILGSVGVRLGAMETECVGNIAMVAQRLDSPWPMWAGLSAAVVLMLAAAAFAQVAVGGVGVGILKMFKPGGAQ